ncbi:AraC family transcriptional regulator [Pedobacter sp. MC2016-15]|uniref:AraC family transcriptional regulator n=1 Tax=Pedobacter sp. MC2016-15 TaxID=2994473 RepID=UPI002246A2BD|nr:AraC family transcriptional regulator [Pedobacter sp. MC2016-15]MCX2478262.1 AraC family transcriptional regulator [Pedobacter sp. MC2016-15]
MRSEHLYHPFSVSFETLDEYNKSEHQHSFFELVYIISGKGRQCINQFKFDYHAGHLFLITPQDCHSFEIDETTEFFFLRFNDIYIKSKALQVENVSRLEYILHNANHKPGCILKNQSDKGLVKPMVEALLRELVNKDIYDREITEHLVNTIIVIVARNIAKYLPEQVYMSSDQKIVDILNYLQRNIFDPGKTRASVVSEHFGISEHYLGKFFKKHSGQTMQSYLNNYRSSLIEHRLKHSDKRMNEIVVEMGFTDESHLNKFFKNQKGISPTDYRKAILANKMSTAV